MNQPDANQTAPIQLPSYLCGESVLPAPGVEVRYPWDNSLTGSVASITPAQADACVVRVLRRQAEETPLSRYRRHVILETARQSLARQTESFASLIRRESGLCIRDARYEVGRATEVLKVAATLAMQDDAQTFDCDVSASEESRRIHTFRKPLPIALAITPFNHPLNQVAHKVAPAIAAGTPLLLKPSEKTPLSAVRFCELLYEAGLPQWMLSVFLGPVDTVVEPLIRDERIALVTFTGGTSVGKRIASIAGYKKLCLELGGNAPLIILPDADLDLAVKLACEGNFRNSGQRCTAVKRTLVHEQIHDAFVQRFVEQAKTYTCGDPADESTRVGTVIDEASASDLRSRVEQAVADGARVLLGGGQTGALMQPTVLVDVPRHTRMVASESFGPLAPVIQIADLDDAIDYANAGPFGLSSAVVTHNLNDAMRCVREIESGTTNINQVPGYRLEYSPFGGVRDSGLGIKEGVAEAMRFMTNVKTYSIPW